MNWTSRDGVDTLTAGDRTLTVRPGRHPETGARCYIAEVDGRQVSTNATRHICRAVAFRKVMTVKESK